MKKTCIKIILLLLLPVFGIAQRNHIDSLKERLKTAGTDSARFATLIDLGWSYSETNLELSLYFHDQAFQLAKKVNRPLDEASALTGKGYILLHQNKFPESLQFLQQAVALGENQADETNVWFNFGNRFKPHETRLSILANAHLQLGHLMGRTNNIARQIAEYKLSKQLAAEAKDKYLLALANMNLGHAYIRLNRVGSALVLEQSARQLMVQMGIKKWLGGVDENLGEIYFKQGNAPIALRYFQKSINTAIEQKNFSQAGYSFNDLTKYNLSKNQKDSSLYYAKRTIEALKSQGSQDLGQPYENMYKSYKLAGNTDSAYKYQGIALIAKDSSYQATTKSLAEFQKLSFQAQIHAQDLEKEKAATQTRIRTYVLIAAICVLLLLTGIFYRNNRQKQKANHLLSEQKEEIERQRNNLGKALGELKETQTQLIQSEKMASLGELTAGIAHEIQNPLNFVNNFSEVNREMLEELKAESEKPKAERDERLENELINDLIENEQKINHHGKRADAIVKGMLEHSRSSTGQKEPTDMNKLADEYMRLAYHGLRAKDKNFNADLVTHFDPKLAKVNVSQQDIGRVMLNLFNNGFYAVNQKAKTAGPDYRPTVEVTTLSTDGQMIIMVRDNGSGIPEAIKDKIMQPFFTTKPTGEGTGLGLSLSYDIVVKGHEGSIDVNTETGKGSEFIVTLPVGTCLNIF